MKKIMLTRSRSMAQLAPVDDETVATDAGTNVKKKQKVNPPPKSSRRATVANVDVEQTKLKPNLDIASDDPQSASDDHSSNTEKKPRKSKGTSTETEPTVKQKKPKVSKSHDAAQKESIGSLAPISEKTRRRSMAQLPRVDDESVATDAGTTAKKKPKVNPPPKISRRATVANVDVEQTNMMPNSDIASDGPQSASNDHSSNTQKNPRKSKGTSTKTEPTVKQTKSKASKSHDAAQKESIGSLAPISEKTSDVHACHNAIEQVLAANYADVQKRLKLPYPALCIQSLVTCSKEHARNSDMTISDNISTAHTFLKNHQPLMFMHIILMDVLSGKFPGRNLMPLLFELILCINEPSLGEYDVANVVDTATFTITRIIERFPPCWLAANKEYRTFLQVKEKHLISGTENFSTNHTLFEDLMNYVESAIQAPAKSKTTKHDETFANDSLLNESHDLQCFSKWELKHTQKFSFDILPRDQKIHRIFTALSLYVLLFEADLAMWTLRNIQKTGNRIFDRKKGPLIGLVLWSNDEPNQVNYTIKNILKLFVNYVSVDFPSDETHILSRLVNLIFDIFDLSAFRVNQNDDCIDYPQPVDEQSYLCDAFIKIIFDSSSCCIDLWFKIIGNILHPKLKLCLINALLTKIEHKKIALNPEKIYQLLRDLESNFEVSQNNNVVKTKDNTVVRTAVVGGDSNYPYLQKVNKRVASALSYEQQAELYLIALRAYMDIYHIDEIRDYWKNYDQYTDERKMALQRYSAECNNTIQNEPVKPYDLARMKKRQSIPFDIRIKHLAQHDHIHRLDVMYEVDGVRFQPKVDVKEYRNDEKFVDLIADEMEKLRTKFDALFPVGK